VLVFVGCAEVRPKLHFVGGITLLLVGTVTLAVPHYAALLLVGVNLAILAIVDHKSS